MYAKLATDHVYIFQSITTIIFHISSQWLYKRHKGGKRKGKKSNNNINKHAKPKKRVINYPTADEMGIPYISALVAGANTLVE